MAEDTKKLVITERGSEAFYREVVNAAVQYRALLKKPTAKLKDFFKYVKVYGILCGAFFLLVLIMAILWGFDALSIVALVVSGGALFVCLRYYTTMKKTLDGYLQDKRASVLTLDETGI